MKVEKMYLKIYKIAEDAKREKRSLHYLNEEDGMYFSLDGHVGYFLPMMYNIKINNGSILSLKEAQSTFKDYFDTNDKNTHPPTEITRGKIAHPKKNILRNNILRLKNELCTVYIQEKFIRKFPANTVYYISGPTSPVVAGIWQDDKLYAFAVIMPIRLPDNYFVEREQVMIAAYEMR